MDPILQIHRENGAESGRIMGQFRRPDEALLSNVALEQSDGSILRANLLLIARFGLVPLLDLTDAAMRETLAIGLNHPPTVERLDALCDRIGHGFHALSGGAPSYPVLIVRSDLHRGSNGLALTELEDLLATLRETQPRLLTPFEIRRLALRFEPDLAPVPALPFTPLRLQQLRIY